MLRFFQFSGKFPQFTGTIIDCGEKIDGLTLPHQIVKNGKPEPLIIATDTSLVSWEKQQKEKGKEVIFSPSTRNKKYTKIIITKPGDISGKVIATGSFGFGQKIFFTNLLVDTGSENVNIAFRPFPSEKRTAGQDLCGKQIAIHNDNLFYITEKGEKKLWNYYAR